MQFLQVDDFATTPLSGRPAADAAGKLEPYATLQAIAAR